MPHKEDDDRPLVEEYEKEITLLPIQGDASILPDEAEGIQWMIEETLGVLRAYLDALRRFVAVKGYHQALVQAAHSDGISDAASWVWAADRELRADSHQTRYSQARKALADAGEAPGVQEALERLRLLLTLQERAISASSPEEVL